MILYLKIKKKFIEGEDALWTSKTKQLHLNKHLDATAQFTFQLGVFLYHVTAFYCWSITLTYALAQKSVLYYCKRTLCWARAICLPKYVLYPVTMLPENCKIMWNHELYIIVQRKHGIALF